MQAIGTLELLFHFVAQYAPEGDVGRYSDKRIAAALDWCGSVPKLIDGLVTTGWLDRHPVARLVLHGWNEHADRSVLQRLSREGKKPIQSNHHDAANLCTQSEISSFKVGALPEPEPVPEPEGVPGPVPEPERISFSRRPPTVMDLDDEGPQDFQECFQRYAELTGMWQRRHQALIIWERLRAAGSIDLQAISCCLESYRESKQVADGACSYFDNWLTEQSKDRWRGRWTPRRATSKATKQQQNADAWGNA